MLFCRPCPPFSDWSITPTQGRVEQLFEDRLERYCRFPNSLRQLVYFGFWLSNVYLENASHFPSNSDSAVLLETLATRRFLYQNKLYRILATRGWCSKSAFGIASVWRPIISAHRVLHIRLDKANLCWSSNAHFDLQTWGRWRVYVGWRKNKRRQVPLINSVHF